MTLFNDSIILVLLITLPRSARSAR